MFNRIPGRGLALALVVWSMASSAQAYTTRLHIAMANEVRRNVIAEGGGGIRLMGSGLVVQLAAEDAAAIMDEPLAFRAGAIGPDNLVFPAMTDGSHGVEQDPYRQCELLYEEALTRVERAYALGCFLHGATDAIAHHYVNAFTGETFTLNPLSSARLESFDNVVGHIVTEASIQKAFVDEDASRFDAGQLEHSLPQDFILRTYFAVDNPVWQRLAEHPLAKFEAARAADPEGSVLSWAQNAELAAWEQIALAPVYVEQVQQERANLRAWIEGELAALQADATLGVGPGADGILGTADDTTACSAGCPDLAARYYVYVRILQPRLDAGGRELPSAFDALSNGIGDQLYGFLPALVQVIANLSAQLNAPIVADGEDHGLDLDPSVVSTAFQPINDWADTLVTTTATGFDGLANSLTPDWYQDLSNFFASLGVDVTIGNILRLVFGPLLQEIRQTLIDEVVGRGQAYLNELTTAYREQFEAWNASVDERLVASTPDGLGGHALNFPYESGLYTYSIDLAATAFGNHEVLLVDADPIGTGPASFDASYTPDWTQIGRCNYLREVVFPHGTGLGALLSVVRDGTLFEANVSENSPVECHDGLLTSFGEPSVETCRHVTLTELMSTPVGSVSRAFPPELGPGSAGCRNLTVPGLPEPPPPGTDGGVDTDGGVGPDGGTDADDGGCGCATPGRGAGGTPWALLLFFGLLVAFRARTRIRIRNRARVRNRALALGACLLLVACSDDGGMDPLDGSTLDLSTAMDATTDLDAGDLGGEDAGPDPRRDFLEALDGTVWSGLQSRDEGGALVERAYEQHFDGSELRWGTIRNPYGPGRQRVLRTFNPMVAGDGSITIDSTVMIPTGWETPESLRGRRDTWTFEIVDGAPRQLVITDTGTGFSETYDEGPWPAPTEGLTAEVRVFGSTGPVFDDYCGSSSFDWGDSNGRPVFDFARGASATLPIAEDVAAGAILGEWVDGIGTFAVTDIAGFDRLGGTELSAQENFVVRYTGTLPHDGHLSVREEDDLYDQMAAWVFVGDQVGLGDRSAALFEIFHLIGNDDEIVTAGALPTAEVEVEVIVVWCNGAGGEPFTLQQSLVSATGPWEAMGTGAIPPVDAALFPPVL